MKKNLRILNLIDIPWHSALAAYAFDQSLALTRRGHQIFFAAPAKTAAAEFATKNNFPLVFIPERKSYNLAAAFWRLRRFIKTERIDILNAHTGKTHTLAWLLYPYKNLKEIGYEN